MVMVTGVLKVVSASAVSVRMASKEMKVPGATLPAGGVGTASEATGTA